tara:strand:- start:269 stop:445 length:177 start_codon:yes stop_codon:yes gene_type:complete
MEQAFNFRNEPVQDTIKTCVSCGVKQVNPCETVEQAADCPYNEEAFKEQRKRLKKRRK